MSVNLGKRGVGILTAELGGFASSPAAGGMFVQVKVNLFLLITNYVSLIEPAFNRQWNKDNQLSGKMSVLISQSVINYVEEENIPALKALLEKCKDVDERNEVRTSF